jgi:GT2 family glycosyltransferase
MTKEHPNTQSQEQGGDVGLSIVVVTWNARKYMPECLKSIQEQETGGLSMETIVVDNASSDSTAELIRHDFPAVKLIQSEINLGFARANNVGIGHAKGKYLFLINPDVIVLPGCLKQIIDALESEPSVGLLGPRMLGPDKTVRRSTMRFPTPWNSFCRALALDSLFKRSKLFGGFLMADFKHDRTTDVDILNGWFWAVKRDALNHVGGLDDHLFMYGDDLDWSYRFHRAGYRNVYCSTAEAIHFGGGTTAKAPVYFYIERQRANIQFWRKYHSPVAVGFYLLTVLLNEVVRLLGYSALFMVKKSSRANAILKMKLSAACLLWLSGVRSNKAATA